MAPGCPTSHALPASAPTENGAEELSTVARVVEETEKDKDKKKEDDEHLETAVGLELSNEAMQESNHLVDTLEKQANDAKQEKQKIEEIEEAENVRHEAKMEEIEEEREDDIKEGATARKELRSQIYGLEGAIATDEAKLDMEGDKLEAQEVANADKKVDNQAELNQELSAVHNVESQRVDSVEKAAETAKEVQDEKKAVKADEEISAAALGAKCKESEEEESEKAAEPAVLSGGVAPSEAAHRTDEATVACAD